MNLIFLFLAIATAIWGLYAIRMTSMVVQCLGVIVSGSIIGFTFFNVSIGPIPVTIDRVLFLLVLVQFGLFAMVRREQILRNMTRIDLVVVALFVLMTASTFLHDFSYKDNLPLGRLLFFNWMPMAMYFVVRNCQLNKGDIAIVFVGLAIFGIYLSVTSCFEVFGPQSVVFPSYIVSTDYHEFLGRARGPFLNPVSHGLYQIVCLSAAMMLWPHLGRVGKATLLFLAPLFLVGTFLTLTRSIWLTAVWAGVVVCWLPADLKYKSVLATVSVLAGLIGLMFMGDLMGSFKRDKHVSEYEMAQSAKLRPMLATVAFEMFKDRPVFGCGFGQYTRYKKPYHYESTNGLPLRTVLPYMQHNVALNYLTELGIVGLGLLMTITGSFMVRGWRLWRDQSRSLWSRQTGLVMLVVISAYVINGMFHDVSIIPMIGILLYFFGGLTVNLGQNPMQDEIPIITQSELSATMETELETKELVPGIAA